MERPVEHDLVVAAEAAQNGHPASVIHAQVGFESDGLIGIVRGSSEDDWREAILLNGGQWDRQFCRGRRIGDDLELSRNTWSRPCRERLGHDKEIHRSIAGVALEAKRERPGHRVLQRHGPSGRRWRRWHDPRFEAMPQDTEIALEPRGMEAKLVRADDRHDGRLLVRPGAVRELE